MVSREAQKIACPPALRRRLEVFRVDAAEGPAYFVKDSLLDENHTFEPWQFFVLEVVAGCKDFPELSSVFESRFGKPVEDEQVRELFELVDGKKWFGVGVTDHPIVLAFRKKRLARPENGRPGSAQATPAAQAPRASAPPPSKESSEPLPPGVIDVIGLDDAKGKRIWKLFDPRPLLKFLDVLLSPLRLTVYLLPLMLIAACGTIASHFDPLVRDLEQLRTGARLLEHLLFSMLTVNLCATWATGLVAHRFRATVSGFCIVFHFGILPRFGMQIGNARELSRRERIWLHAAPLLTRLALFSVGILLWYGAGTRTGVLGSFGLALSVASAISFFITANPLIKSSAYNLICAYLDQPFLRGKAYRAILGKVHGGTYQRADANVLIAYGLASSAFLVLAIGALLFLAGRAFKFHLGPASLTVLALVAAAIAWNLVRRFREIDRVYQRTAQFERWRKRTLPTGEAEGAEQRETNRVQRYVARAVLLVVAAAMFLPYTYEPGGSFVVLPQRRQELASPLSGLVEEVYFDGGELLRAGTLVGRLSDTHDASQMKILEARILEQEATIAELESRPLPQEVLVAESAMETEVTRVRFSEEKLARMERLFEEDTVSLEDIEEMRREHEINVSRVEEKRAALELLEIGATPEQLAAAQARLQGLREEHAYYAERVGQARYTMPFDGRLVTTQLKQKIGSFLDQRQSLAVVESTEHVVIQIDMHESDLGFVEQGAEVRCRIPAYHDEEFRGTVSKIDSTIAEEGSERAVRLTVEIPNPDGRLKTGMAGYAKVRSEVMPVWRVLSLSVVRFFQVEVWSWLP